MSLWWSRFELCFTTAARNNLALRDFVFPWHKPADIDPVVVSISFFAPLFTMKPTADEKSQRLGIRERIKPMWIPPLPSF
ncbi:hypothetical protein WG66_008834 [Moniliophthora roreri]|nr:hypothetical protein WG66_008834 [Moniliophthora roreri]